MVYALCGVGVFSTWTNNGIYTYLQKYRLTSQMYSIIKSSLNTENCTQRWIFVSFRFLFFFCELEANNSFAKFIIIYLFIHSSYVPKCKSKGECFIIYYACWMEIVRLFIGIDEEINNEMCTSSCSSNVEKKFQKNVEKTANFESVWEPEKQRNIETKSHALHSKFISIFHLCVNMLTSRWSCMRWMETSKKKVFNWKLRIFFDEK